MAEEQPTEIKEQARARAAERGIEALLARKYPELYKQLREIAEESGVSVFDLMASLSQWAVEVRTAQRTITKEDLKNVTPEALNAALKLVLFYQEQYYKVQAYANVAAVQALYNIAEGILAGRLAAMRSEEGRTAIPLLPPSPGTVERIANAVLRAIELFTLGKPEVSEQIATAVAKKLIELSQQGGQQAPGG